jgi:hypothetical protein
MNATDYDPVLWGTTMRHHERAQMAMKRAEARREREETEHLSKRYAELTAIAARLLEECGRLRADNEDLRASAEIWIRMYEQQVERVKALERKLLEEPRRP